MLARRHVVSLASILGCLLLVVTAPAAAQKPKPKPPPPPGVVQPACEIGCIPDYAVEVTPDNANAGSKPMNTGGYNAVFTVRNTGALADSYTITCPPTGPVTCTGISATSISLNSGATATDTVFYSVGNAGVGQVRLLAESDNGDATNNWGSWNVTVLAAPGPPIVAFRNQNGDNADRSMCLTTAAGEAAAWGCGDLVVTHGLPGYSTMGRERALTLLYNSAQAVPKPLVAVAVTNGGNTLMPDSVHVELLVNGVPRATAQYSAWGGIPATTRQISLTYDATVDSTGIYAFSFLVRNKYTTGTYDVTVADTLIVVNRSQSEFGAGWSLVGVERLVLAQPGNKILWVGGDGSAKVYRSVATNVWQAAAGSFRDTLLYDPGTTTYARTLRHGVQVKFDAQGRHIQTINRLGQTTILTWSGSPARLTSILVPPGGSATTYTLAYDGNSKLDAITDPVNRVLNATVGSNRLTTLVDPDLAFASFGYDAAGRMISRTTRRGYAAKFAYAQSLRMTQVKVPLNPAVADTAVTAFTPWDQRGLAIGTGLQAAVDTALAYTKIDGPRTTVADTAEFWTDRWGAPAQSRDPNGNVTQVLRGNPSVPALVTKLTNANGAMVLMSWDNRANLLTRKDSTAHLAFGVPTALSRWTYNSPNAADSPDSVIDAEGVVNRYAYTSLGLVLDATDAIGHVTHNDFVPSGALTGMLSRVIELQVPNWDSTTASELLRDDTTSFSYNTLGNLIATTSPLHRVKRTTRDFAQRVDSVVDPAGHPVLLGHDLLNRQTTTTQFEAGASLVTRQHWAIDVVDSIVDPRGVVRTYQYDAANRQVAEVDDYGKIERRFFGKSGLLDSLQTRYWQDSTGRKVRHIYDAAGRETKVAWPARRSAVVDSTVPRDSVLFTYNPMDQVLTALTLNRKITRTYYGDGTLRSEIQGAPSGTNPNTHFYGYDRVGKRTWYRMGTPGSLAASDSVWYRYHPTAGTLQVVGVRWQGTGSFKDSVRFAWDALGRRDTVAYRNGTTIRFSYDADGQRRTICAKHNYQGASPDVFNFTKYAQWVNVDGLLLHEAPFATGNPNCVFGTGSSQDNTYNTRHMVLTQSDGAGSSTFVYDWSGNITRTTTSVHDDQFVIDPLHNRMRQVNYLDAPGVGTYYFYDLNGGRLDEVPFYPGADTSNTLHRRHYYYDGFDRVSGNRERLCSVDYLGNCLGGGYYNVNSPSVCRYDGLGRLYRVCESMASTIGYVGFDGDNVTRTGEDGQIYVWSFVHGPGVDDPIMGYSKDLSKGYAYYITDGGGRQLAVGDTLGWNFTTELSYYQNGGKLAGGTQNANTFSVSRNQNPTLYKLSFFRNRFYDQETGRWTQEDPLGVIGGVNLYQYAGNNPVSLTDPFGLCSDDGSGSDTTSVQPEEESDSTTLEECVARGYKFWENSIVYAPDRLVDRLTGGILKDADVPEAIGASATYVAEKVLFPRTLEQIGLKFVGRAFGWFSVAHLGLKIGLRIGVWNACLLNRDAY